MMELEGILETKHYTEMVYAAQRRATRKKQAWGAIAFMTIGAIVSVIALTTIARSAGIHGVRGAAFGPNELVPIAIMVGIGLPFGWMWLASRKIVTGYLRPGGSWLGPRRYVIDENGVAVTGPDVSSRTGWSVVTDMTSERNTIVVWTDPAAGLMIPRAAFRDEAHIAELERLVAANAGTSPPTQT
jgi:hypothetical protein